MIEITIDLNMVALWTTVVILIVMCLYTYLVFKFHKAYAKRFDSIYRLGIPLLVFAGWQALWWFIGWQMWTLLLLFEVIANAFFYFKMWNEEGVFEWEIPDLERLSLRSLYLYFFDRTMVLDANMFLFENYSATFATVEKIIEENHLMDREREQFDSDEKWMQYEKSKAAYARRKEHPELYHVDVLGFYSILSGCKMLIFVHEGNLPRRIFEGNAVRIPKKIEIEGHEFEKIICLEGQNNKDTQRRMEADVDYLDIMTSLTLLESIPGLKAQNTKKDDIIEKQQDAMENMKDDVIFAEHYFKYNKPSERQSFDMGRFARYNLFTIAGIVGVVILLILLMRLGVL